MLGAVYTIRQPAASLHLPQSARGRRIWVEPTLARITFSVDRLMWSSRRRRHEEGTLRGGAALLQESAQERLEGPIEFQGPVEPHSRRRLRCSAGPRWAMGDLGLSWSE